MSLLRPSPIASGVFHYDPQSSILAAELSDLGPGFRLGRVYDDACDIGLTVISDRTGLAVVFAVAREKRDSEGELQYVELAPAQGQQRSGVLPALTVRLYND